jgi:hypothetical protein
MDVWLPGPWTSTKRLADLMRQEVGHETALTCGICGATAEELAPPLHPPLDAPMEIRPRVLEAHMESREEG